MSLVVAWLAIAWSSPSDLAIPGLKWNEKLQLESRGGFWSNSKVEVQIRSVRLPAGAVAEQKMQTDFNNIKNLYKTRANPYQGQVSELVECAKEFLPRTSEIQLNNGVKATLLAGGVSGRHVFGVCSPDDVVYWGGFFQFYQKEAGAAVEVRMYVKRQPELGMAAGQKALAKMAEDLFQ